jgi:hypothetical protein
MGKNISMKTNKSRATHFMHVSYWRKYRIKLEELCFNISRTGNILNLCYSKKRKEQNNTITSEHLVRFILIPMQSLLTQFHSVTHRKKKCACSQPPALCIISLVPGLHSHCATSHDCLSRFFFRGAR